jgi:hypothetical protein
MQEVQKKPNPTDLLIIQTKSLEGILKIQEKIIDEQFHLNKMFIEKFEIIISEQKKQSRSLSTIANAAGLFLFLTILGLFVGFCSAF